MKPISRQHCSSICLNLLVRKRRDVSIQVQIEAHESIKMFFKKNSFSGERNHFFLFSILLFWLTLIKLKAAKISWPNFATVQKQLLLISASV